MDKFFIEDIKKFLTTLFSDEINILESDYRQYIKTIKESGHFTDLGIASRKRWAQELKEIDLDLLNNLINLSATMLASRITPEILQKNVKIFKENPQEMLTDSFTIPLVEAFQESKTILSPKILEIRNKMKKLEITSYDPYNKMKFIFITDPRNIATNIVLHFGGNFSIKKEKYNPKSEVVKLQKPSFWPE